MKNTVALAILLIIGKCSFAQTLEFNQPVSVGDQINSLSEEVSPLLASDGNSLYFVRAIYEGNLGGKIGGMDIWRSGRDSHGQWLTATNEKIWNNKENNAIIGISNDGKTIYLLNAYKNRDGIAFSRMHNDKWTDPQLIPMKGVSKNSLVGFYMNSAFNVLVISKKDNDSLGQEDLYVSTKDSLDQWSEPVNLGSTVNTSGFEISPFLSANGKQLYFSSNGQGGYGDADIFVSDRLYDSWSVWSKPRNLGPIINSDKFDAYFSIYRDSIAFFSSNRNSTLSDIFQTTVKAKQNSILKDSVDRIVRDAQKLLSDLKDQSNLRGELLSVNLPLTTSVLEKQLGTFLKSFELQKIKRVEIISYSKAATEQTRKSQSDVINYFTRHGMARENLNASISSAPGNKDRMEIKIFIQQQ